MKVTNQHQETTNEDLSALLLYGDGPAMVTLTAGDTELAVHRAVLGARSHVFAELLSRETPLSFRLQIVVPDVDGPVLRQLVAYMYTLRHPQVPSMVPQLLAAADKYGVVGLKALCEQQVAAQLDIENAAETAVLAVKYSCPRLKEATVNFIKAHIQQVMATKGWADTVVNHPHTAEEFTCLLGDPRPETGSSTVKCAKAAPGI